MKKSVLLPVLVLGGLLTPLGAEESALVTAPEWLASRITLGATEKEVIPLFSAVPARSRVGDLVTVSFAAPPQGVRWPEHVHEDGQHADSCDSTVPWSFQFRAGRLISVMLTMPEGVPLSSVMGGRSAVVRPSGEPIPFAVWRLDAGRVLLSPGLEQPEEAARQFLLIDSGLLRVLYPRVAASLDEPGR
ncbi:MAG: hypothetical protein IPM24_09610 [Bryobacterales bacterium]|nr:hypothetical protein [Bryobacterales bacterium]